MSKTACSLLELQILAQDLTARTGSINIFYNQMNIKNTVYIYQKTSRRMNGILHSNEHKQNIQQQG